jgi:hypothetical protein
MTSSPQLVVCPTCNTTSFLQNGNLEDAGKAAVLTEEPSIFKLHHSYKFGDWKFTPVGRVKYSYGDDEGVWDEWYVRSENGKESWVSVDEGEIAIENLVASHIDLPPFEEIKVGGALMINRQRLTVIEKNTCTCLGTTGQIPFIIHPNETSQYIDLLGPRRLSFSLEFKAGSVDIYKGIWIDPFEIKEV